jgi:hypothetical protein
MHLVVYIFVIVVILFALYRIIDMCMLISGRMPYSLTPINKEVYDKRIKLGTEIASQSKIVICALVRDVARNVENIKTKVYSITKLFEDYRVLIVENDSTDGTRELLLRWSQQDPKIVILGCGVNADKCTLNLPRTINHDHGVSRINKMVFLRNLYLKEIRMNYADFNYMLVWDLDLVSTLFGDGVMNTIGYMDKNKDIDGVCAQGIYSLNGVNLYYDTYAHVDMDENIEYAKGRNESRMRFIKGMVENGSEPYGVKSCFGGATIYKIPSIVVMGHSYQTGKTLDGEVVCEHVGFHHGMNVVCNPSMLHILLHNP